MFLKALEIQGFKSFPDRTRIGFDKGITSVVGPNGSGKSNISDAIRWVMGETSAKQLRGGGKMENVIFGGTAVRNAMGYASVQLVVDNSDRRLDVEADEVTIGRKYYRSGESEYSVNGQSVRLRDVYELLLDTGLGRDGYSVIGQGRIAEIVGAKSNERREIFEEASGIARFRYRKNEAERRLAATEENLVRLRDILGELETRVGPLEKESIKAKKFIELSEEKKSMEVTLWVDTVKETREVLRGQQRKIEIAQADYDAKGREVDLIDSETQEIRTEIEAIIIDIDNTNASIRKLQEEVSGRDSRVAVLKNDILHNTMSIQSLQQEIEESGESASAIEGEIALHTAAIARAEKDLQETQNQIHVLEKKLCEIQKKSLATGERRGAVQAKLAAMTDEVTTLLVQQASAVSGQQSAEERLAVEEQNSQKAEENLKALLEQKEDTEEFLKVTNEEIKKLGNIKNGLELKLAGRKAALTQADDAERAIIREEEAAEQRILMLQDLERSLDGFQASVKSVVKAGREGRLRGIIGPVSTILSVQPGYEIAIETVLGYSLQNVVVDGENAAKAAMAFLKQTNGGRATFLPLDTVKGQFFDSSRLPNGAISAQKIVNYDKKYENIVSSLLARIVVVDDINEASRVAKALDYRNRIVTRDGQIINAGGSFTGGSVSRSAGLFSRKQEIEDLRHKLNSMKSKKQDAQTLTDKIKAEVDRLTADMTATDSEAITAGGDKIRGEAELARLQQGIESAKLAVENFNSERAVLVAQIEQSIKKQQELQHAQTKINQEIENYTKELSGIAGDDDSFLAGREEFSSQLSELRLAALGHERDAELHRQSIKTLYSRTGESEARRLALRANIEKLTAQNGENQEKIKNILREAEDTKQKIELAEQNIRQKAQIRLQKEGSITGQTSKFRAISAEREDLGREIARLTEQKAALETKYDTTISQLWDEYELTLSAAEGICVPFESAGELRRKVAELRSKIRNLGHVNVGAIEEYEEVSNRYSFLKAQVEDVENSKASLEKMIQELSVEMTAMFAQSFAAINNNFGRIFSELFGGGRGVLSLSNPDDLLESGIEIEVAPPGKIIKDLSSLSGGEQALVAICIYFAILAVNPAPFCVLDEIEAALDDVNVVRYAQYLRRISDRTQFIVITHRRGTMEEADVLYGVTMQEDGVSKLLRLNVADVDATLVR